MEHHGLDIVVPFYNEERILDQLCQDFIAQVDDHGRALDKQSYRVVAVNNASTDSSVDIITSYSGRAGMPEMVIVHEMVKGVVQARKTGSEFAMKNQSDYPYLLHIDADNRLPDTLVWDAIERFKKNTDDILAYSGHFSLDFWNKVPQLAQCFFEGVGIIEFSETTRHEFGFNSNDALFSEDVFNDFIRVPNQLGLGVRKDIFKEAGAYLREYQQNGEEILGEARNLWFRLDRLGARLHHVRDPFITLNARRLLCDPVRWCGGRSYDGGMLDLRQKNPSESDQYLLLNELANSVNFSQVRSNLIKRLIIEPCVAKPSRLNAQPDYFDGCLSLMINDIKQWSQNNLISTYADVLPLVLHLCEQYSDRILQNMCELRGIDKSRYYS